jgi:hypothetical protein
MTKANTGDSPEQPIFSTRAKESPSGLRVTVTMEAKSEEMMQWALLQGFTFARERWMGVTVHHKDDPMTRVSCRTTKLRKRKERG